MTTHFTFFWNLTKDHLNEIYEYIFNNKEKYFIEKFIVSYEEQTSKGKKPHIHFYGVFNIETLDYTHKIANNLCKVFVDKYKLRKSQKGGKVNYGCGKNDGKLKKTPEQTMTYHTKEKQYLFFGWPDEYVKSCEEKSFIKLKDEKLDYIKLLKDKILIEFEKSNDFPIYVQSHSEETNTYKNYVTTINYQIDALQKFVFDQLLLENKDIKSFSIIKTISRHIIQYSENYYVKEHRFQLFKRNN